MCKRVSETGNGCPAQIRVKQRKMKLFRVLMFEFVRAAFSKSIVSAKEKDLVFVTCEFKIFEC